MPLLRVSYYLLLLLVVFIASLYGEPVYIGYSDYQIVTDSSFNATKYFRQMEAYGINFQRIWALGYSGSLRGRREKLPFPRKNGKYDLKRIDPAYISRLRKILGAAQKFNQRVMLTLFDHWSLSTESVFLRGPWFYKNSRQRLLRNALPDFYDLRNEELAEIQRNYVRAIVQATAEFHPIYEIMNEGDWKQDCELVDRWHQAVADWIRESDADAVIAVNVSDACSQTFEHPWLDVVSLHGTQWINEDVCGLVHKYTSQNKQVIIDTDGAWKTRDDNRLMRQWLAEALKCGASFNHKDDIYRLDFEVLNSIQAARQKLESQIINE